MGFLFGSSGLLSGVGSALSSVGTNLIQPITGMLGSALSPLTSGTGKDGKGKSALEYLMKLDDSSFKGVMEQINKGRNTSADVATGVPANTQSVANAPVGSKNTSSQFAVAGPYKLSQPAYPWQQYNDQTWRRF